MSFSVDVTQIRGLADELATAMSRVEPEMEQVVERGALNVRSDARRRVRATSSGRYRPHYPRSITYDVETGPGYAEAEIGPDKALSQGGAGPGVEFGGARNAPRPHLLPAFDDEVPKLVRHLGVVTRRVLR